jgi:monoamine oxidase
MHDAMVVGAGLSGLVCACRLADAGAEVIVVEAQARVGGRALGELGAQWMSPGQPRLAALAAELGVATFPQLREGAAIVVEGATPRRLEHHVATIHDLIRRVESVDPGISFGTWLDREVADRGAREAIELHCELTFAAHPGELSLLYYLAHLGATGGFGDPGRTFPDGAREHRFTGGAQELGIRLAARLGDRVRLREPVTMLESGDATVAVTTTRDRHVAARAVLAIPPAQAARIAVVPAWPPAVERLATASRMGPVVKVFVGYERAFWRDAGLSGELYQPTGTVRAVVEATAPGGPPALLAMIVASEAARWSRRDPDERRAAVLAELAEHFGADAASPTGWIEHDWSTDPWSGGCVAGLPPGVLAAGAAWRAPHGRIHLAGTESASEWPGYLEGAIEAGERAAAELLAG